MSLKIIKQHVILVAVLVSVLMPPLSRSDDFMSPGLTPEAVLAKLDTPEAPLIVDLRKPIEFGVGHIPGAVNIPVEELTEHLDTVKNDNGVLIYCINGSRTRQAEPLLYNNGITNVFHLEGAFYNWIQGKHPVEKGGVKKKKGW